MTPLTPPTLQSVARTFAALPDHSTDWTGPWLVLYPVFVAGTCCGHSPLPAGPRKGFERFNSYNEYSFTLKLYKEMYNKLKHAWQYKSCKSHPYWESTLYF